MSHLFRTAQEQVADVTTPLRAEEDDFSLDGGIEGTTGVGTGGEGEGFLMADMTRSSMDEDADGDDGAAATDHTPLR